MSGRLTLWGSGQFLSVFLGLSVTPSQSFWLALVRDIPPSPYVSGTELDEPDNEDYARVEIPNNPDNWANDSAPQVMANLLQIDFVTATSDWGPLNYWALCDSASGGNNYFVGILDEPMTILTDDQAVLFPGDLSVALGPFFLIEEE
jgi:hypothetical protein